MDIGFPHILIALLLSCLIWIFMIGSKNNKSNEKARNVRRKQRPCIFGGFVIIIIVILLLVASSGCASKNPDVIINNNNNISQTATGQTQTSIEKPTSVENPIYTPTEKLTPIETQTSNEKPTSTKSSYVSSSKEAATPTPIDISPYMDWNFTTYENSMYSTNPDFSAPDGYTYVKATIHINNEGNEPISTMPDCWKFILDGVNYSYDALLTPTDGIMKYEVKPGEKFTFEMDYVVKGTPTSGSLSYVNPYVKT